ncbi:hypothetical protein CTAYLR_004249 [Chrysophaeum taylorii]|uniref:RelA/SpoT domain-containing protein n=1 Tax=Chrysophaeum taylorii TaxID=2483200 RepID=A0AAD7UEV3_9STRA|nr:hypothetical protein CTAYLR_004249 [Chrysophaeum taylorii]
MDVCVVALVMVVGEGMVAPSSVGESWRSLTNEDHSHSLERYFERPGLEEARKILTEYALADGVRESGPGVPGWIARLFGVEAAEEEVPRVAPLDEAEVFQRAWRDVRRALSIGEGRAAASSTAREATALLAWWATRAADLRDVRYRVDRGVAIAEYIGQTPFGGDGAVVAAALLCEAHEAGLGLDVVRERIGGDAAALLTSLSNLEQLSRLQRARWDAEGAARWGGCRDDDDDDACFARRQVEEEDDEDLLYACRLPATHAENLRHMLVAVAGDFRALPLFLSRRLEALHDECGRATAASPSSLARDALDVHAPLAERFGLYALKNDLEDAAFERLAPATRRRIVRALDATRDARATVLADVSTQLRRLMLEDDVLMNSVDSLRVSTREKEPFSVWRKQRKLRERKRQAPFLETSWAGASAPEPDDGGPQVLYPLDTIAFRVVLEPRRDAGSKKEDRVAAGESLCYRALDLVHSTWKSLKNRTKDYVASPKPNGYQSLHTTVLMRLHGASYPFEVQIRTVDMHLVAEFGSAAHVLYHSRTSRSVLPRSTTDALVKNLATHHDAPDLLVELPRPNREGRRRSRKLYLVAATSPNDERAVFASSRRRHRALARRRVKRKHRAAAAAAGPDDDLEVLEVCAGDAHLGAELVLGSGGGGGGGGFDDDYDQGRRPPPCAPPVVPKDDRVDLDKPFRVRYNLADDDAAAQTGAKFGKSLGECLRAERVFVLATGGRVLTVGARSNAIDVLDALVRDLEIDARAEGEATLDHRAAGPIEINGRRVEWLASLSTKLLTGDEVRWVEERA